MQPERQAERLSRFPAEGVRALAFAGGARGVFAAGLCCVRWSKKTHTPPLCRGAPVRIELS